MASATDSFETKYAAQGYQLVWNDEFSGDTLDRNSWNVELHNPGWVNSELQSYVDSEDNIQVHDGSLYLIPQKTVTTTAAGTSLLTNPGFTEGDDGMAGWGETIADWENPAADASSSINNGAITYLIKNPGTEGWHVQLQQENLSLTANTTYHFSARVTSTIDRTVSIGVVNSSYQSYGGTEPALTANEEAIVAFDFTPEVSDSTAKLQFNLGSIGDISGEHSVTISDISLTAQSSGSGEVSYTSGRINTQNNKTFTYGIFECRAKVPAGRGYLPAFWLMSNDESIYGQWPRCGEIDCMEVMGQNPDKVYGTIHFGNPHSESQSTYQLTGDSFADGFHTFTTEWEPGKIIWYVDGIKYHETSDWYSTTEGVGTLTYPAPFDQPFYIILNLAVGGSWVTNPDENTSFDNNPFVVDYVRVYQKDSYDENVTRPEKPFEPRDPDANGSFINNGSFADAEDLTDDVNWKFMTANGGEATASISDNKITVATTNAGSVDYSVQLVQAGLPFQKGATYQVSFDAKAADSRTMNVDIKAPDHGYKSYMSTKNPALTDQMQTFTYEFKMKDDSDLNGRLEFNMGAGATDTVEITNVVVKKLADPDPNEKEEKTVLSNGSYIYNGSFQEGAARLGWWTLSDTSAASVTGFSDGRRLKVTAPLTLSQDELTFPAGVPYQLSFDAQGEGEITVDVGGNSQTFRLSGTKQLYSFKLPASATYSSQTVTVTFPGSESPVYFDNIKLVEDAMIKNGSFNDGLTGYEVYVDSSASATCGVDSLSESNALGVTVNNTGDQDWKVQVKQNGIKLERGKTYTLSYKAKSDLARDIRVVMQGLEDKGWPVYNNADTATVSLTNDYQTFTDTFTMSAETDPNAFLSICLGKLGDAPITTQHTVFIDDITLIEVESTPAGPVELTENDVTIDGAAQVYNGTAREPAVTVSRNGTTLIAGTDYTVAYQNNIDAGTATVTVTGVGSYTGTVSREFTIAQADISAAAVTVDDVTYTGKTLTPALVVKLNDKELSRDADYTVSCKNNTNGGTATVTVTGAGNYTGSVSKGFAIKKADQSVTADLSGAVIVNKTAKVQATGIGAITYSSNNTKVATVSSTGVVKGIAPGSATITVKAAGNGNFNAGSATVKVTVQCATPAVKKVENVNGGVKITLGKVSGAVQYRVFYKLGNGKWTKAGDTTGAAFTWKGAKNGKTYIFTVRALNKSGKYVSDFNKTGKSITYVAAPTLKSLKSTRSKTLTAAWGALKGVNSYELQYSTVKSFKGKPATIPVRKAATASRMIEHLGRNNTYYVRIRSCKSVSGKTVYSAWSNVRSAKVK